jgi:hypothetical protein
MATEHMTLAQLLYPAELEAFLGHYKEPAADAPLERLQAWMGAERLADETAATFELRERSRKKRRNAVDAQNSRARKAAAAGTVNLKHAGGERKIQQHLVSMEANITGGIAGVDQHLGAVAAQRENEEGAGSLSNSGSRRWPGAAVGQSDESTDKSTDETSVATLTN